MTLLFILGVTEILCSLRLVLEKKTDKKIRKSSRLEFLQKFLANNFPLSDAEENTSRSLNTEGTTDLPLLRTLWAICQKSQEPSFWEVIDSFGSFKNPFATDASLSDIYLRFRRFILLVQNKKDISLKYGSSKSWWRPWRWVRLDLTLTMRDTYIKSNLNPLTNFNSSSRCTEVEAILSWKISQMIRKIAQIGTKIFISYVMKRCILFWIWWKVNESWANNIIRVSQWREIHCRTNNSVKRT